LPQGLLKKIEVDLLLTNLALEIGNPPLRLRKLIGRSRLDPGEFLVQRRPGVMRANRQSLRLGWPPSTAQRFRAAPDRNGSRH
jgi:hypothetical protein